MSEAIRFVANRNAPADAEVLGVPVFSGRRLPAGAGAELDLEFLGRRNFEGKAGQTHALLADDGTTLVALGLGEPEALTIDGLRRAAAALVGAAGTARTAATTLLAAVPASLDARAAAQAIAEGAALASYRFTTYKSDRDRPALESLTVV
ncbi:MAG: hypothetical protein H0W70_14735, partial [Actinobacteria bacterium]|nr:hypothetical protein [Actinomycetota bacterium]